MFCHKCGAQIAEGAAFCQKCGAKVIPAEPVDIPIHNVEDQQDRIVTNDTQQAPTNKNAKRNRGLFTVARIGRILIGGSLLLLLPFWHLPINPVFPVAGVAIGIILSAFGSRPLGLSKIIELAVAVVLLVVIAVSVMSSGGGSDQYIQMVKGGTLNGYPHMTVGKAFDNFLDDPKWESGLSDDNVRFVNVKGGILYYDEEAELVVQFFVDETTESFQYNACKINCIPQNNLVFWSLLETVYNGDSTSQNSSTSTLDKTIPSVVSV